VFVMVVVSIACVELQPRGCGYGLSKLRTKSEKHLNSTLRWLPPQGKMAKFSQ
jgi:hypothetical protein